MEKVTLMLVDDNRRFLSAAKTYLGEIDDLVLLTTLEGGTHAVAKAKELEPDVILVDLAMPDIAGLQLIPLLRESMPNLGIVALTVHDNEQYREAALEAGADAFITKSRILQTLEPTIKEVKRAHAPTQTAAPKPEITDGRSERILVMDDDHYVRIIYSKALRHKGYVVDLAASLDQARALIDTHVYGIFICDVHMGNDRSTDLLNERGAKLDSQGTVIIMISAGQYRYLAKEYGCEFFLEKPSSIRTLVTIIGRILGRASHGQAAHQTAEASAN